MDRFDILNEHINDVQKQRNNIDGEELLDNQDLLQMLKISNRSLQRYRSSGKLPYYTISGKLYYKLSDVHQFIRDSFNTPFKEGFEQNRHIPLLYCTSNIFLTAVPRMYHEDFRHFYKY